DYPARQRKLIEALDRKGVSAFLVTHLPNIRYLCGLTGSAGVLAVVSGGESGRSRLAFFTDGRYTEQANSEVSGAKVVIAKGPALASAAEWLAAGQNTPHAVGFEAEHMSVASRSA